jgi:SnoaL-like domain
MAGHTPAGKLAALFGNVAAMSAMYAPAVEWTISASLGIPRLVGRDAVVAFNTQVWSEHHRPDCSITILDELGDETSSAVRFTYRAWSHFVRDWYENEYTLFVKAGPEGIHSVVEALDTSANLDFLSGHPIGHGWAMLGGGVGDAVEILGRSADQKIE